MFRTIPLGWKPPRESCVKTEVEKPDVKSRKKRNKYKGTYLVATVAAPEAHAKNFVDKDVRSVSDWWHM